jgi:glycosyltransferase involved in cell wall biosynthesis
MKIIHVINSLKKGGAEGNLYRLCRFQKKKYKKKIKITIITLIDKGFYEADLKKLGVNVISLKMNYKNRIFFLIKKLIKFRKILNNENPDIIQSWMYHSNFITLFIPIKFYEKIFWNIRHSELNMKISKKSTILISIICGFLSSIVPKKIIYCSERSKFFHEKFHFYYKRKSNLVENGFSFKTYFPSKKLRLSFRKKEKINKNDLILGYAGRYARQKNLHSMLLAFSKISKIYNNLYLYMVGRDIGKKNNELLDIIKKLDIKKKVFFLSEQKNLLQFYNGIDLLVLTSHSESFPNVIAESMLCSTPVFSSNAGCAKKIINNYGFLIMKNDDKSIFHGLKNSINLYEKDTRKWNEIKNKARSQIKNNFSIKKMAEGYLNIWT